MIEVWKDVAGYEGLYQVSNRGNVKSLDRVSEHRISGKITLKGKPVAKSFNGNYYFVNLTKDGKTKRPMIHRLVAVAFLPNPDNSPCINHKDENKLNNAVENLEWCNHKYNSNYGTCIDRSREKKEKEVLQYDLAGNYIRTWKSVAEAERIGGYDHRGISRCATGKRNKAYGYIWRYKEAE